MCVSINGWCFVSVSDVLADAGDDDGNDGNGNGDDDDTTTTNSSGSSKDVIPI